MAAVFIENLRVDTVIGICEWELQEEQPLFFDIHMESNIDVFANSDNIENAVDYAVVAEQLVEWVKQDKNKLLESMVIGLADYLLQAHSAIDAIEIKVRKPRAIAAADSAGIVYKKIRV